MIIQTWTEITISALQGLWQGFIFFIPRLFGSIILFVIGWLLASGLGGFIARILTWLKFNKIFERTGWQEALEKAELKVNPSQFIGGICKWILVIVFLVTAVRILFLGYAIELAFLDEIIRWLPNLVVAIAIFIVAVIIADILGKIVQASVGKAEIRYTQFLGAGVRWAIYILAGLMILRQLGVTPTIIDSIVFGFVGMFALAFGLAFGLGGKDVAAEILQELKKKLKG